MLNGRVSALVWGLPCRIICNPAFMWLLDLCTDIRDIAASRQRTPPRPGTGGGRGDTPHHLILSHVWSAFRCWQNWHIRWITHDIGTNNGRKWQRNVIILLDQKRHTVGAIFFENQNACLKSPRMHQSLKSLWPPSRGAPEVSKTPPTCQVWMILSQVMAI